jgi:hypothetical protein
MYYEWDTSDPSERPSPSQYPFNALIFRSTGPIVAVMLLTNTITLIMLLILLILQFRPWLDAARVLFLLLAHTGVAGTFALWNPSFQCPTSSKHCAVQSSSYA